MSHNMETGRKGEMMAMNYLEKNSYRILEKNWRYQHREIDIIAQENDCLVIVEVKTRSGAVYADPVENMTLKKQSFLVSAADEYIRIKGLDINVRYDVICINFGPHSTRFEHIKNAFHPIAY
jgi:putative endonuclease